MAQPYLIKRLVADLELRTTLQEGAPAPQSDAVAVCVDGEQMLGRKALIVKHDLRDAGGNPCGFNLTPYASYDEGGTWVPLTDAVGIGPCVGQDRDEFILTGQTQGMYLDLPAPRVRLDVVGNSNAGVPVSGKIWHIDLLAY